MSWHFVNVHPGAQALSYCFGVAMFTLLQWPWLNGLEWAVYAQDPHIWRNKWCHVQIWEDVQWSVTSMRPTQREYSKVSSWTSCSRSPNCGKISKLSEVVGQFSCSCWLVPCSNLCNEGVSTFDLHQLPEIWPVDACGFWFWWCNSHSGTKFMSMDCLQTILRCSKCLNVLVVIYSSWFLEIQKGLFFFVWTLPYPLNFSDQFRVESSWLLIGPFGTATNHLGTATPGNSFIGTPRCSYDRSHRWNGKDRQLSREGWTILSLRESPVCYCFDWLSSFIVVLLINMKLMSVLFILIISAHKTTTNILLIQNCCPEATAEVRCSADERLGIAFVNVCVVVPVNLNCIFEQEPLILDSLYIMMIYGYTILYDGTILLQCYNDVWRHCGGSVLSLEHGWTMIAMMGSVKDPFTKNGLDSGKCTMT